jgi:2-hydroxychromene-2-carboxylate isomerase
MGAMQQNPSILGQCADLMVVVGAGPAEIVTMFISRSLMSGNAEASNQLEFFFDLSSPWTYLGFTNIQHVAARTGANIVWRPVLAGAVFNAVNQFLYELRALSPEAPRMRHARKALDDWAALTGITITFPPRAHPARSVHAMRMAAALEDDQPALQRFAKAAFEAYFGRDEDLDDPEMLVAAADSAGLDGAAIRTRSVTDEIKLRLRTTTDELIERGGYGSPTIFVNGDDMYFGNDQLPLVELALQRARLGSSQASTLASVRDEPTLHTRSM